MKMEGRVAMVTGANTGIGLQTAMQLYKAGYKVVLACRNEESAKEAMQKIKQGGGTGTLEFMALDLGSFDSVRRCATAFKAKREPLHVLINNAGMNQFSVKKGQERTKDGFDCLWQVNFLSHFLLTDLLVASIAKGGRIVNFSSVTHRWSGLGGSATFERYSPSNAPGGVSNSYSDSKLAMGLVTHEWQRQLAPRDITVHSVNPGAVNSDIWRDFPFKKLVTNTLFKWVFLRPSQGAAPAVTAATHPALGDKRSRYINPYWHPLSRPLDSPLGKPNRMVKWICGLFDYIGPSIGANEAFPTAAGENVKASADLYNISKKWTSPSQGSK